MSGLTHETGVRLAAFAGAFGAFAVLESLLPARPRRASRLSRWTTNIVLAALGTLALRFGFPVLAVGAAEWARAGGFGLLNATSTGFWPAAIASLLLLDLAVYAQHVAMHRITALWSIHRVHHADREVDTSTGLRFHPFESAMSMLWKMSVIVLIGAPATAVVAFEIILNAAALFNHANLALPPRLDRFLKHIVVTPAMHRIHHANTWSDANANYGFCLAIWDRAFGTYHARPDEPSFPLGLPEPMAAFHDGPWTMLAFPFRPVTAS